MQALTISRQVPAPEPIAPAIKFVSDWPEPAAPGPGQARVRTLAAALNHLDLWVARGLPGVKLNYPRIGGSDACGIVESVGPGVDAAWVGKRVILNASINVVPLPGPDEGPRSWLAPMYELLGEHHQGVLAEFFLAPVANLQLVRDDQDPTEAAAFGLTFLTAYSMLRKVDVRVGGVLFEEGIGFKSAGHGESPAGTALFLVAGGGDVAAVGIAPVKGGGQPGREAKGDGFGVYRLEIKADQVFPVFAGSRDVGLARGPLRAFRFNGVLHAFDLFFYAARKGLLAESRRARSHGKEQH